MHNIKLPKFEIADLDIQESDPMYADAVRCVQTYWKQASHMTYGQRQKYLWYLECTNREDFLVKPFRACDDEGNFLVGKLSWPAYLLLSTLYEDLPKTYIEAIEERYGSSVIEDHTDVYRHFYPAPISTKENAESITESASTRDKLQNVTPTQGIVVDVPASTSQQMNPTSAGSQLPPAIPELAHLLAPESQNIDTVVGSLSLPNTKRLSSAPESSPKRARLNDNEVLEQVTQRSICKLQSTIEDLHSTIEEKGAKLQEVCEAAEQNRQTLSSMQDDLRKFMSAVMSTLRDIQESFDE
ncbi:hypothetical protein V8C37DRAFT_407204 [Trichoderma ceciliae]